MTPLASRPEAPSFCCPSSNAGVVLKDLLPAVRQGIPLIPPITNPLQLSRVLGTELDLQPIFQNLQRQPPPKRARRYDSA
jgi:hypothetical protein